MRILKNPFIKYINQEFFPAHIKGTFASSPRKVELFIPIIVEHLAGAGRFDDR